MSTTPPATVPITQNSEIADPFSLLIHSQGTRTLYYSIHIYFKTTRIDTRIQQFCHFDLPSRV